MGCKRQTICLTAGTDTKSLTTGNDTVTGDFGTLQTADVIVDSTTTDADTLTAVVTTAAVKPTIASVETLTFDISGAGTVDAASITNAKSINFVTNYGAVTAHAANLADASVVTVTNAFTTLNVNGSSTKTTNAATVELKGGVGATTILTLDTDGAGVGKDIDQLSIKSTGSAANKVKLNDAFTETADTIAVSGDQDLTVNAAYNLISGATLTKSMTGTAKVSVEVTGNLGNSGTANLDKIAADTIILKPGAVMGDADVFVVKAGQNVSVANDLQTGGTAAHKTTIQSKTSDGTIGLSIASGQTGVLNVTQAAVVNLSTEAKTGVTSYTVTGLEISNVGVGKTTELNITANNAELVLTNAVQVIGAAKIDTVTIAGDKLVTASNGFQAKSMTITDTKEVLISKDSVIDSLSISGTGKLTVADSEYLQSNTVTATGSGDITIGESKATTFDAGGSSGKLTIKTTVADQLIKAGSGNDSITLGVYNTDVFGNGGNDTVTYANGQYTGLTQNVDLGIGNDTLDLSAVNTATTVSATIKATLGDGVDTIKLFAASATDGKLTLQITDFAHGLGGDVFDFSAALGASADSFTNVVSSTANLTLTDNDVVVVNVNTTVAGKNFGNAEAAAVFGASAGQISATVAGATQGYVIVQGTDKAQLYYVDSNVATATGIATDGSEVILIGTIDTVGTYNAANFGLAA